jgi:hypothetical protein
MKMYEGECGIENHVIQIDIQCLHGNADQYWVNCTARAPDGQVKWVAPLTTKNGDLKLYEKTSDAIRDTRNIFSLSPDEMECFTLAQTELDPTLYFLSLI